MKIVELVQNKIVKNAGWIMAGRILHMVISFFIGMITARYLGPDHYGVINYAGAYTTFFMAFCTLGIDSVIIKDFVDHPEEQGTAIGTTLALRLISSFLSICVIVMISMFLDRGEPIVIAAVALYSMSLLFKTFDTLHQWFQSKLLSKYYTIATLIAYFLSSAYKVYLFISQKSVLWFAVSNSIDYLFTALIVFWFYRKNKGPSLSVSVKKAKQLLSVSKSYILSGMMVAVYAATDKLMLKQMLSERIVGYYSLAVSVSTIWAFVLASVIDSMKPPIMELHRSNPAKYLRMNKLLYALVFYISTAMSLIICLVAPILIRVLYGEAYVAASGPLRIIVWYVAFSYLGVARDIWIVCEKKQKYLKYLYFLSALLNVALNYLLIPVLSAEGAAIASLLTQMSTIILFPLLFKELRPNLRLIMEAIFLRGVLPAGRAEKEKT